MIRSSLPPHFGALTRGLIDADRRPRRFLAPYSRVYGGIGGVHGSGATRNAAARGCLASAWRPVPEVRIDRVVMIHAGRRNRVPSRSATPPRRPGTRPRPLYRWRNRIRPPRCSLPSASSSPVSTTSGSPSSVRRPRAIRRRPPTARAISRTWAPAPPRAISSRPSKGPVRTGQPHPGAGQEGEQGVPAVAQVHDRPGLGHPAAHAERQGTVVLVWGNGWRRQQPAPVDGLQGTARTEPAQQQRPGTVRRCRAGQHMTGRTTTEG